MCCVWDFCMLWVKVFFFHCSEHHTEVWRAEMSFSQHWRVLKSVWSVERDWAEPSEPSLYDQYLAYRNRHYTFLPGFGWSLTACLNSDENVLCNYIYFTPFLMLLYIIPAHSTPLLFLVMWFLYSAVEAVKSFIVEFNLVNTVMKMGEKTCLTQCC